MESTEGVVKNGMIESSSGLTTLNDLPDSLILKILSYLNSHADIGRVAKTNWRLNGVSSDEILWRNLFHRHFRMDSGLFPGPSYYPSWRREFRRLIDDVPSVESQVLSKHTDQVLHVSFSHDGKRFATSAKDALIVVWKSGHPVTEEYSNNMKFFSWKYTQFSQFNESDTLLLVSGVLFGHNSTSGEISIFSVKDEFQLQCRVMSKPYDIFGTWVSDMYFLSGQHQWLNNMVSKSVIWINKASQESQSEHASIMNELYKFYNPKASSVRSLMIANCFDNAEPSNFSRRSTGNDTTTTTTTKPSSSTESPRTAGNPPSSIQHESGEPNFMQLSSRGHHEENLPENIANIHYSAEFRNHGPISGGDGTNNAATTTTTSISNSSSMEEDMEDLLLYPGELEEEEGSPATPNNPDDEDGKDQCGDSTEEEEDSILDPREKLLIFTCSSATYTPHRIGFKRIPPMAFKATLDPGPSIAERIQEYRRRRRMELDGEVEDEINWADQQSVRHRFDEIDKVIDLHGHIIGMVLSPDHRYLYVNSRPWPEGYKISNPLEPPPIASEIDIHCIDLKTISQVGMMRRAHRAYTPNEECFFIFLDACDKFVASGAEDKHGYVWDRHYGISLIKLPHTDVVNSVAFNPKNSHMLVSVSDDFSIKIWRSKAQCRKLGLDISKQGTTLYNLRRQRVSANSS